MGDAYEDLSSQDEENPFYTAGDEAADEILEVLSEQESKILSRWAGGDDTTSVASHFGIPVDLVQELQNKAMEILRSKIKEVEITTHKVPDEKKAKKVMLAMLCSCENCGTFQYGNFVPYCNHCGHPNPVFDESMFFKYYGSSLREAIEEDCNKGHPGYEEDPEMWQNDPYCHLCGKRPFG